jgi:hypothetical protein
MSDVDTPELNVDESQAEAEAIAAAQAGYARSTRGYEPPVPAETSTEKTPAELADDASGESNGGVTPEQGEGEDEPIVKVEDELKALKAKVAEISTGTDPQSVRKLHGEIGNINRTLKQLQSAKSTPANDDKLAAALKKVEEMANDYPEFAAPVLDALKVLGSKQELPDLDERISKRLEEDRRAAAIEAIDEAHPDRHEIKDTPEFKAWFASKAPDYQERINTTWNPAVLSQCFTDFKKANEDARAARQKKQDRLAAAVTPKGSQAKAQPTTLPDDAGFARGYAKGRGQRL